MLVEDVRTLLFRIRSDVAAHQSIINPRQGSVLPHILLPVRLPAVAVKAEGAAHLLAQPAPAQLLQPAGSSTSGMGAEPLSDTTFCLAHFCAALLCCRLRWCSVQTVPEKRAQELNRKCSLANIHSQKAEREHTLL